MFFIYKYCDKNIMDQFGSIRVNLSIRMPNHKTIITMQKANQNKLLCLISNKPMLKDEIEKKN